MIGGFRSVLCVSVFPGSLLVIVIMIDRSEKRNCTVKAAHELVKGAVQKKKMKRVTVSIIVVVAVPGVPGPRVFRTLFLCPIHPLAALTMAYN